MATPFKIETVLPTVLGHARIVTILCSVSSCTAAISRMGIDALTDFFFYFYTLGLYSLYFLFRIRISLAFLACNMNRLKTKSRKITTT